jgi:hypothetical protein
VPDYDLVTSFTLWLFGSFAAGGLIGFAIGKLLGFETGMGVGLLVPGVVSLSFTVAFASEYLAFRDAPDRATGRVVEVEDRAANASGSITTPVAIVEYESRAGTTERIASGAASGLQVGEEAVVIRGPGPPRVARPKELFGGTIASLLFGTFPASAAIFFFASALRGAQEQRGTRRPRAEAPASRVTTIANVVILAGLFVPGLLDLDVLRAVLIAFGIVSIGLWMHVAEGIARGRDPRWWLGIGVIAINFSVWSIALWWLAPEVAGW